MKLVAIVLNRGKWLVALVSMRVMLRLVSTCVNVGLWHDLRCILTVRCICTRGSLANGLDMTWWLYFRVSLDVVLVACGRTLRKVLTCERLKRSVLGNRYRK